MDRGDGTGVEERGGVAHAAWLEQREFLEVGLLEFGHIDPGVEFESWHEIIGLQSASGRGFELVAEHGKVGAGDAQTGGHVVSAEGSEPLGAVPEGLDERKAGDAASAAMAVPRVIETDDDGGAVVFAAQAGSDDADHPGVPAVAAHDDGAIAGRVEVFLQFGAGGFEDLLLELLAFAVAGVEIVCESAGFGGVFAEEEPECGLGGVESSGGVEARSEAEADFGRGHGAHHGGDFHQGAEPFPAGLPEAGEAVADDDAVFAAQRREVADGAHGGKVEKVTQVGFAAAGGFLDPVAEFEDECRGAEIGVAAEGFRIDQRGAGRGAVFRFVVVDDDEVDSAGGEPGGLLVRTGAAIEGDDERGLVLGENAVESVAAQAVAFGFAQREET